MLYIKNEIALGNKIEFDRFSKNAVRLACSDDHAELAFLYNQPRQFLQQPPQFSGASNYNLGPNVQEQLDAARA